MSSTPMTSSKIGNKKMEHSCNNLCRFFGIESGAKAESLLQNFIYKVQRLGWPTVVVPLGLLLIECKSHLQCKCICKSEMPQNCNVL